MVLARPTTNQLSSRPSVGGEEGLEHLSGGRHTGEMGREKQTV
jgi:hypothetical protein